MNAARGLRTRVLFVHSATASPLGADLWVQAQIIAGLDRAAYDVHVACAPGPPAEPSPLYQILRRLPDTSLVPIDLGPELYLRDRAGKARGLVETLPAVSSIARLVQYVRRHRISIIHTNDRPRDAAVSVAVARLTGATSVVQLHVVYGPWMSGLRRWPLAAADVRIGVSQFIARSMTQAGLDPRATFAVPNAVDLTSWVPGEGRAGARQELGLGEHDLAVVTVCRLFPPKGVGELIRALGAVRTHVPHVKLVVVGTDLSPDGAYRRELTELAGSVGLGDAVLFTGHRADVPRLMAAADVYAMPSLEEPFGLVYAEAMAMELPVVALDSGGTPEVVEHGVTGLLSQPGDTEKLEANLLALLCDSELRTRMGTCGRQRVEEHFTVERMARQVADVYRRIDPHTKEPTHARPVEG